MDHSLDAAEKHFSDPDAASRYAEAPRCGPAGMTGAGGSAMTVVEPSRRALLAGASGLVAAGSASSAAAQGAPDAPSPAPRAGPITLRLGGYGPAGTGFSRGLKRIGDRLSRRFGDRVEVKYVYNILDLGYRGEDILWLVESGLLTLGYQSSSYLTDRVPDLGLLDLPFLFPDVGGARAAMDGELGGVLAATIEERMNYRILGWYENGFRHLSNRLRPIRRPADMAGMTIRVLPSEVQARTFQLLGAVPQRMDLADLIARVKAGTIDAQENPLANTVTYGVHRYQRFHTLSGHFYLSRPIFLNRTAFDSWPADLQAEMRAAVADAVAFQRGTVAEEEATARAAIEAERGEILTPSADEHAAFAEAVRPLYAELRDTFPARLRRLVSVY